MFTDGTYDPGMVLAVLRVWLDDRPGSLASVAGQIGALQGDLIGIDVLERGGGRVIDEFVVELADMQSLDKIVSAVDALGGVDVELADFVPEFPDPRLDALELAGALVSAATQHELLETLVSESRRRFGCTWAAVVDRSSSSQLASSGPAPHAKWVTAFVTGISESRGESPVDVAWAALSGTGLVLVFGRDQTRFRDRERRQIAALADIAAIRYLQTSMRLCSEQTAGDVRAHPSWGDKDETRSAGALIAESRLKPERRCRTGCSAAGMRAATRR